MNKIRHLEDKDLNIILEWRNHPSIRKSMLSQHVITMSEHLDWYKSISSNKNFIPMIYEEENLSVGYVSFSLICNTHSADWGFYSSPFSPKGTGIRMGVAALDFAFKELNLEEIYGQTLISNKISQNFHSKLGFKKENLSTRQSKYDLKYHEIICYSLKQADWLNNEKS